MKTAILLHTSKTHLERFEPILFPYKDRYQFKQVVHENLLARAQAVGGLTHAIKQATLNEINTLKENGADGVLITCSTLGPIADETPNYKGCKIIRIDDSLAKKAVEAGKHIAVICAIETTLDPTQDLFEGMKSRLNLQDVIIDMHLVPNAWDAFLSGNVELYAKIIAEYISTHTDTADIIALAQASMDKVEDYLINFTKPVLSSPKLGVEALIDALE